MFSVKMLDAKTNLSRYVALIESGEEERVVIARGNKPVAMLVPFEEDLDVNERLGAAEGLYDIPDSFDDLDEEIEALFYGEVLGE